MKKLIAPFGKGSLKLKKPSGDGSHTEDNLVIGIEKTHPTMNDLDSKRFYF